jgi:hypothetical protein
MDPVIGKRFFITGATREIYQQPDGQQYIMGPGGKRLYGQWISPEKLDPFIVEERPEDEP